MTQPNDESDRGYDEEDVQRLMDELERYSLHDLRMVMQMRLVDHLTSEGLTSEQALDALALLRMLSAVMHGRGEVADRQRRGNWSELHVRSYDEPEM